MTNLHGTYPGCMASSNAVFALRPADMHPYMTDSFKERSMGLVCDFTDKINTVYTAVFPSDRILNNIFADNPHDAMLFLHHLGCIGEQQCVLCVATSPAIWDFRGSPQRWFQMDNKWVEKCKTATELSIVFSSTVGHKTKLYPYGDNDIIDGWVAVVAGGGNDMDVLPAVLEKEVYTLITGITVDNDKYAEVHQYEKDNRINVLGGTHYSTEKFACQRMCEYFSNFGLSAQFVEDTPIFEDL